MPAGRERDLSNDQLVAIALAVIAVTVAWSKRRLLLSSVGDWLQSHQITLPAGHGLVTVTYLGGVDLPRLLAAVAVLGLIALTIALPLARWFVQARQLRTAGRGQRDPAADEFD